ncbi:MAG: hypothetical protein ACLQPD_33275 [Desulfomonilaceae bacterium]
MNSQAGNSGHTLPSRLANPAVIVVLAFIISRALYYYLGVRFDIIPLYYAWQFLGVNLLQNRLIESVFYLHSQPPLFNLFLGVILKTFPNHLDLAFHILHLAFGLIMAVSLVVIMNRLGLSRGLSTTLAIIFVASPTTILYENWLLYTYPIASILCLSAVFLHKWLSDRKSIYGAIFFICLACLVLTWSLFQALWIIAACVTLYLYGRIRLKSLIAAVAIPLILIMGWQVKNWHYFGFFGTSSWMGLNLARSQAKLIFNEETLTLVEEGKLSRLLTVPAFSDYDAYREYLPEPPKTDIPSLDQKEKDPPSFGPNYNYIGYVAASKASFDETICVIKSRPGDFVKNCLNGFAVYLTPATDYLFLGPNRDHISFLVTAYNAVFYGSLKRECIGLLIVYSLVLSIGYGAYLAGRWIRNRPEDVSYAATVIFVWLTISYVTAVVNLFENQENNRMRFIIEPYTLIILGIIFEGIRKRWARGRKIEARSPAKP